MQGCSFLHLFRHRCPLYCKIMSPAHVLTPFSSDASMCSISAATSAAQSQHSWDSVPSTGDGRTNSGVGAWGGGSPRTSPQLGSIDGGAVLTDSFDYSCEGASLLPLRIQRAVPHLDTFAAHPAAPASSPGEEGIDAFEGRYDIEERRLAEQNTSMEIQMQAPMMEVLLNGDIRASEDALLNDRRGEMGGEWPVTRPGQDASDLRLNKGTPGMEADAQVEAQSPKLEIKRRIYTIIHDAMQYARTKGDIELHRMINR